MNDRIRYAVVGLGHIAQTAVLPAFKHARGNSELAALVSGDGKKIEELGRRYGVYSCYSYADYVDCLESGGIDAVYIATPNTLHHYFAGLAIQRGIHVLCEKPMATDEKTCLSMIQAAERSNVKLMVAYRLHFEPANLEVIDVARRRGIGDLKIFHSVFTMQVRDRGNIRLKREMGGGPLFDIGIYCVNAVRNIFQDEPREVVAMISNGGDARFTEVDECVSAILRFPGGRVAAFTVSFGAADTAAYDLIGTSGSIRLERSYEYAAPIKMEIRRGGKVTRKRFEKHDQFAPELVYFSDCILNGHDPEPSGWEGLADVRVIEALVRSTKTGVPATVEPVKKKSWPSIEQKITRPPLSRITQRIHVPGPGGY